MSYLKECVAVLIELNKSNVSVSCVGLDLIFFLTRHLAYSKDVHVERLGYPLALVLIMGRY